ncbi:hypothetical protein PP740_gp021 [Stenotrophomonas phage Philippe]|uniref:Uncharacterized protein n=1 Tax=Stenotrophomonas phage Philippe TaxID=2859655 RepID=A0AAE7WML3_9CAUD|nr:hypothetical protein PP740_gp021 [Stenotrophomonas phage Philippe]QYW02220.1 hypothetical protein CPT_Philippe_021 [Stenotrophomonas phage Philippe]
MSDETVVGTIELYTQVGSNRIHCRLKMDQPVSEAMEEAVDYAYEGFSDCLYELQSDADQDEEE